MTVSKHVDIGTTVSKHVDIGMTVSKHVDIGTTVSKHVDIGMTVSKHVDIGMALSKHVDIIHSLLDAHVMIGCDTVARCNTIGNNTALDILKSLAQPFR